MTKTRVKGKTPQRQWAAVGRHPRSHSRSVGTDKAEGILATGDVLMVSDNDGKVCITLSVVIYGDANGDGKINSQDLRRIQRHILGVGDLEGHPLTAADVNRDGKVNSQDLRQAQRYILELTATLQPTATPDDSTTTS